MRSPGLPPAARALMLGLVLALALLVPAASALRETLKIDKDSRTAFHIRSFGFAKGGTLNLIIHDFKLDFPSNIDPAGKVALVIEPSPEVARIDSGSATATCFHNSKDIRSEQSVIIKLTPPKPASPGKPAEVWKARSYNQTIEAAGYYHMYFSNCMPASTSTLTLFVEEFNMESTSKGLRKNYLSIGETQLPFIYAGFTFLVGLQCLIWIALLAKRRNDAKTIHVLMAVVIVVKFVSLFAETFSALTLQKEGSNNGWAVAFYVFNANRGFLMFSVIVLIGTGWSHLKPFLTHRDKQIILAVLLVQALVNVAWIVVDATSPGSFGWVTWNQILLVMDMLCCCFTILPIMWSIHHLKRESERDGKLATSLQRLQNFRSFYAMVIVYVYFTRIAVFLVGTLLPYNLIWCTTFARESASVVFFFLVGSLFRPQSVNPYLALEGADEMDAFGATDIESGGSGIQMRSGGGAVAMADSVSPTDEFDDPITDDLQSDSRPHMGGAPPAKLN